MRPTTALQSDAGLSSAAPPSRGATLLGAAWIVVIAASPVLRLLAALTNNASSYAIVALLVITLAARRIARPFGGGWWVVGGFLVLLAGLASGQGSDLSASAREGIVLALLVGGLPFVLRYHVQREQGWLRRAVVAFLLVQTTSALAGLAQVTFGASFFGYVANQGRANGLSVHPNVLGVMATIAVLVLVYALRSSGGRVRAAAVLGIVINGAALLATGSLSNLLALAVGFVVLMIASRWTVRAIILFAVVVVTAGVISVFLGVDLSNLSAGLEGRVATVTGQGESEGSLQIRQQTWAAAWQLIQVDPIVGYGFDSANAAVYGSTVVHNYLLQFWYRGGLAGLVFAVLLTAFVIVLAGRAMVRGIDQVSGAVAAAMLAFAATSAFFDQNYYWIPLLLAVSAGAVTGGRAGSDSRGSGHAQGPRDRLVPTDGTLK